MTYINQVNTNQIAFKGTNKMDESFEINPLDINLEKMTSSLKNRCEREVAEYGDFAPVVEKYENKDKDLYAGTIELVCRKPDKSIEDHNTSRYLEVVVKNPQGFRQLSSLIACGEKTEIMEKLSDDNFFLQVKGHVNRMIDKLDSTKYKDEE